MTVKAATHQVKLAPLLYWQATYCVQVCM
eukprot:SAG31_NODE_4973_length_2825_cov_1.906090_3_plen_28_part_01